MFSTLNLQVDLIRHQLLRVLKSENIKKVHDGMSTLQGAAHWSDDGCRSVCRVNWGHEGKVLTAVNLDGADIKESIDRDMRNHRIFLDVNPG